MTAGKKYKIKKEIHYGELRFYDSEHLGIMLQDGFILSDFDNVIIPPNVVCTYIGKDKYNSDMLLIGNNEYCFDFSADVSDLFELIEN